MGQTWAAMWAPRLAVRGPAVAPHLGAKRRRPVASALSPQSSLTLSALHALPSAHSISSAQREAEREAGMSSQTWLRLGLGLGLA